MRSFFLMLLAVACPLTTSAQMIPIKTVPVAEGSQFLIFPSDTRTMGGVTIAVDDHQHDIFSNPAKGIHQRGSRVSVAPTYYGFAAAPWSLDEGAGRTLPMSVTLKRSNFFGGMALAWQEIMMPQRIFFPGPVPVFTTTTIAPAENDLSRTNVYAFGAGGMQIPDTRLSVGASAYVGDLTAREGVRMLYSQGSSVDQSGSFGQYRLGAYYQWENGRAAEFIVMHHRMDMTHQMVEWVGGWETPVRPVERTENEKTRGWALQVGVQEPLGNGIRLGGMLRANWKHHPNIPNYDIMQIPRDPGNSSAYNIGIGLSRTLGKTAAYGVDLIFEPIWSHTWANALVPTDTRVGSTIPAGQKTVDNQFHFNNARLRMGVRRSLSDLFELSLGLNAHHIRYTLDQTDLIEVRDRTQREDWTEWSLSAGLDMTFSEFEIGYEGFASLGTGRPGVTSPLRFDGVAALSAGDFLVAPRGSLRLDEAVGFAHRISVSVPL